MLGDSTTAGNGIPRLADIYPKQLEKLLNKKNQKMRYEVLNMAVGGYHTLQEVETLRTKGMAYDPDLVLIAFCLNDFSVSADGGVYEYLHHRRQLSKSFSPRTLFHFLLRHSRLAFLLYHRSGLAAPKTCRWYVENILQKSSPVETGLKLLDDLLQTHIFTARMVILPAFDKPFDQYQYDQIHEKLRQLMNMFPEILLIDLKSRFAAIDNDAKKFSYDGLHMNEYGHRVMAEILLPLVADAERTDP